MKLISWALLIAGCLVEVSRGSPDDDPEYPNYSPEPGEVSDPDFPGWDDPNQRTDAAAYLDAMENVSDWDTWMPDVPTMKDIPRNIALAVGGVALSTITIDALIKRGWLFLQAPRGLLILAASIALFSAAEMLIKYLTTVWGRLTAKPKIVKHVAKGVSAAVLTGEACRDMNDLALAAEGVAEEYYGSEKWPKKWKKFEPIFESAQNVAHHLVIAEVTNLTVEAWPISPPFPVELRNSTVKQTATYNNKLNEWAQEYFYAIPFLQRRIAVSYSNMHYNETLQAIYRGRSHPSWVSDEVGYHKLSLSFLYRISVPTFCSKHVHESHAMKTQMVTMRNNRDGRDARVIHIMQTHFDEDDDTSIVPNFSPESEVEPETWDDPTARRELFAKIDALVPSDEATYLLHFEELGGLTEGAASGTVGLILSHYFVQGLVRLGLSIAGGPVGVIVQIASLLIGFIAGPYLFDKMEAGFNAMFHPVAKIAAEETVKRTQMFSRGLSAATLTNEACQDYNDLALDAEQIAEEHYGVKEWHRMWKKFEKVFEIAQNVAHHKVIGKVANLPIDHWPIPPPFPVKMHNPTQEEKATFEQKLLKWTQQHLFTIPNLQHGIAISFTDMHYNETLQAVYRERNHPTWADDESGYHKLSLSFLYRSSLPSYCLRHIDEAESTTEKWVNMRKSKIGRSARVIHTVHHYFGLRTEMTKRLSVEL